MPRKASGKTAVRNFRSKLDEIEHFTSAATERGLGKRNLSFVYDTAVIKTFIAFEQLLLECLVVAVNKDNSKLAETSGVKFPKDLDKDVSTYLIVGMNFFNFKGFGELKGLLKKYVPEGHWLLETVGNTRHKAQLDLLVKLRNYAAHESTKSRTDAIKEIGGVYFGSAGSWLKARGRFPKMLKNLRNLATEIDEAVPY